MPPPSSWLTPHGGGGHCGDRRALAFHHHSSPEAHGSTYRCPLTAVLTSRQRRSTPARFWLAARSIVLRSPYHVRRSTPSPAVRARHSARPARPATSSPCTSRS